MFRKFFKRLEILRKFLPRWGISIGSDYVENVSIPCVSWWFIAKTLVFLMFLERPRMGISAKIFRKFSENFSKGSQLGENFCRDWVFPEVRTLVKTLVSTAFYGEMLWKRWYSLCFLMIYCENVGISYVSWTSPNGHLGENF